MGLYTAFGFGVYIVIGILSILLELAVWRQFELLGINFYITGAVSLAVGIVFAFLGTFTSIFVFHPQGGIVHFSILFRFPCFPDFCNGECLERSLIRIGVMSKGG